MTPEIKAVVDGIQNEWAQMKELINGRVADEVKKFGAPLGETKAAVDAFNARLDALEMKAQRPQPQEAVILGFDGQPDPDGAEKKAAFVKYLRKGDAAQAIEKKLLTVADDSTGGIAATPEFDMNIIKGITVISPVRSIVRVRNTSNRSVRVMKRTGQFAAQWVSEIGTRAETTGYGLGLEEIPTHELYALVDVSVQDLEDVAFDLEGELRGEFTEQFAKAEGAAVINGTGLGQPEGLLTNAALAFDTTGSAGAVTYDGLVAVSHNIKEGYLPNCQFLFNLKTLGKLRLLKDTTNQPLWQPMVAGAPSTILGFGYTIAADMPDVANNAFPIAFGDFKRAYQLVDRVTLDIQRDPYTQNTKGAIRFIARKRLGGQVVLVEAVRKLKCA